MSLNAPAPVSVVNTLRDAFRWVEHCLAVLSESLGHGTLGELGSTAQRTSMSTAFSGIGGAEVAAGCISAGLATFTGETAHLKNTYAFEVRPESRHELALLTNAPACIFGDLTDLLNPQVRDVLKDQAPRMQYEDLRKIISTNGVVRDRAYCYTHKQTCECQPATIHVAGTSCVSWSQQGQKAGASGPTLLPFLIWAERRIMESKEHEEAFLHENMLEFPEALLHDLFGATHVIQTAIVDSARVGQACDRRRRLTWMVSKKHVCERLQWPEFEKRFRRHCAIDWSAYFIAGKHELEKELEWAKQRPSLKKPPSRRLSRSPFEAALNNMEWDFLTKYKDMHKGCDLVVMLNQNPDKHAHTSAGKRTLPTLIKNTHMLYSTRHHRWLTPYELLVVQNFPVYDFLSQHGETCSFNRARETLRLSPRRRSVICEQAGNSMNVNVMGIALLWWLVKKSDACAQSSLLRSVAIGFKARLLQRTISDASSVASRATVADEDDETAGTRSEACPPAKRNKNC